MMGPEDTADVLKYAGVELTEERKMDKTVNLRENLRRVKELQEEQRQKKEEKEQKEIEEQVRVLTEQTVEEKVAQEEVEHRRQPRMEMMRRGGRRKGDVRSEGRQK